MSYLVLARKWRPQKFEDVVGQDVIVKTLKQALESKRLAHAFLFCGSRGTGKTSLARILAKALCCEKGITAEPCGDCGICRSISDGSSLDVIEIDGASNTGVDDVRELKETIRYQPNHARFKIFIIDEVHMLSTNAFNALLKTLEEPPEHVKFILATTEAHKIPVTIHSRCQRYDFRKLKASVIYEQLGRILKNEGVSIQEGGLRLISQVADGGMRDALSLADQVLSFAPQNADSKDVSSLLGVSSTKTIADMSIALLDRDFQSVFRIIDDVEANGVDLKKFADDVAGYIRHLAISKATNSIRDLADLSADEITKIDELAKQYDLQDLQRVFTFLLDGVDQIARSQQSRMTFELVCLRIADRPRMDDLISITQAISRLESLSKRHSKEGFSMEKPLPSQAIQAEEKKNSCTRDTPQLEGAQGSKNEKSFETKWLQFVEEVSKFNQSIGVYLEHGRPQENSAICFEHRFYKDRVLEVVKEGWFQSIVKGIFGAHNAIKWTFSESQEHSSISIREAREIEQKRVQAQIESNARNHPVVKKALALFGGEIKAVKQVQTKVEIENSKAN